MTDPYIEQRLARIEAVQTDLLTRLSRVETPTGHVTTPQPHRSEGNGRWMRIGVTILVILAVIWFLDELPGPALWDRLF